MAGNRLLKATGVRDSFNPYGCFNESFGGIDGDPPNILRFTELENDTDSGLLNGYLFLNGYDRGLHSPWWTRWKFDVNLDGSDPNEVFDFELDWFLESHSIPNVDPTFPIIIAVTTGTSDPISSSVLYGGLRARYTASGGGKNQLTAVYGSTGTYVDASIFYVEDPGIPITNKAGKLRLRTYMSGTSRVIEYYYIFDELHTTWQLIRSQSYGSYNGVSVNIQICQRIGEVSNTSGINPKGSDLRIRNLRVLEASSVDCPAAWTNRCFANEFNGTAGTLPTTNQFTLLENDYNLGELDGVGRLEHDTQGFTGSNFPTSSVRSRWRYNTIYPGNLGDVFDVAVSFRIDFYGRPTVGSAERPIWVAITSTTGYPAPAGSNSTVVGIYSAGSAGLRFLDYYFSSSGNITNDSYTFAPYSAGSVYTGPPVSGQFRLRVETNDFMGNYRNSTYSYYKVDGTHTTWQLLYYRASSFNSSSPTSWYIQYGMGYGAVGFFNGNQYGIMYIKDITVLEASGVSCPS
jgi:hypothetical protein